jgi:hypothetical protein
MKNLKFLYLLLIIIGSLIGLTTQIINKNNKNKKYNKDNISTKSKRNLNLNKKETPDYCIKNNFTSNELLNYLNSSFLERQIEKYFGQKNNSVKNN